MSLQVAREEIYWYRMPALGKSLRAEVEAQCLKHLSTVRIHLFERGRLNKLLLKAGKPLIRKYLVQIYGEEVVSLHCFFRLETIHQYYKLKFYQYHGDRVPSVSELIKSSRKDFQPVILSGYNEFIKKKRLTISKELYDQIASHQSATSWEDSYTTPEEKLLLKFWFLMDHGVSVTQRVIEKGVFAPASDLWGFLKSQSEDCNS